MEWMPIETAPKTMVWKTAANCYSEQILLHQHGEVFRGRWWQRADSKSCNFIDDGGRARHPTDWMPLPPPPIPKEPA